MQDRKQLKKIYKQRKNRLKFLNRNDKWLKRKNKKLLKRLLNGKHLQRSNKRNPKLRLLQQKLRPKSAKPNLKRPERKIRQNMRLPSKNKQKCLDKRIWLLNKPMLLQKLQEGHENKNR